MREIGTVQSYGGGWGFGFVHTKEGRNLFFHISQFVGNTVDLVPGAAVTFRRELNKVSEKIRAVEVEILP